MKIKKYLGIVLASLMIMSTSVAMAAEENVNNGTIEVTGSSSMEVAPNQAVVRISIENTNKDAKVAASENAKIMQNVQSKLLGLAIPKDKMQTVNYNVYPQYSNRGNNQSITGYSVNNTIAVTVDDIGKLSTVIDTAIAAGANNINSVELGVSNREQYKNQALVGAVNSAKEQAQIVASALGKRIVGVKNIHILNTSFNPIRPYNFALAKSAAADSESTPIQEGTIQLKASVDATFFIQ